MIASACVAFASGWACAAQGSDRISTPAASPEQRVWGELDTLPDTVDAAAVLDNPGGRLLLAPGGRAVIEAFDRSAVFVGTRRAWSSLAQTLGYTEDEAARALLGGRVVVAWSGLHEGGTLGAVLAADSRWVMIAEIDADTARAARSRLGAVPRRVVGGRTVYSIDSGRVGMAVIDRGATASVVLAPNAAGTLFDGVLARVSGEIPGGAGLGGQARAVLGPLEAGLTGVLVVRTHEGASVAALRAEPGVWTVRFAAPTDGTEGVGAPMGVLDEIGGDALLAFAASGSPKIRDNALDLGIRLGMSPGSDDATDESDLTLDGGTVVVLRRQDGADGADGADGSQVSALVLTHGRSADRFAERVDRAISVAVGGEHPPEHRGAFPGAVRTHTLPHKGGDGWPGGGSRVSWCFTDDQDDRGGAISIAIAPAGVDTEGPARKGREAWPRGEDGTETGLVTSGMARPAELSKALGIKDSNPAACLARVIDRSSWRVRREGGLLRGEVTVRFTAPGPTLGAP